MPDSNIPLRKCTKCGTEYPATIEYFHKSKGGKYGLRSNCKTCNTAASMHYFDAHPEKRREGFRRYYTTHSEEIKKKARRWAEANPEKKRASSRQWRKTHPELAKQRIRQWTETHPDKVRTISHNRRARKHAAEGTHTVSDVQTQLKRQRSKCYYCGRKLTKYHVDHVVPLVRGGRNSPDNLVIACPRCNHAKHTRLPHEWTEGGRLL